MKVLLVSANTVRAPYYVYPLGLDYVAGAISKRHTVKIIDTNIVKEVEGLREIIHDFTPHLIGISLRNIDNVDVTNTRSFLKKYQDVGRYHPGAFPGTHRPRRKRIHPLPRKNHGPLEGGLRYYR